MYGEDETSTLAQYEIKTKDNKKLLPLTTKGMLSMTLRKKEDGLGHWK